jgi:hypothetical protein
VPTVVGAFLKEITMTADPTAAIEVLARLLCTADIHVYGDEHPTWQKLSRKVQDDYRKAAQWLLPRLTVAPPLVYQAAAFRKAADAIVARQAKFEAEERADIGELDLETVQQGTAVRGMADYLRRLADEDPITAHGIRENLFTGPQWETRDPEAEERERDIQREA